MKTILMLTLTVVSLGVFWLAVNSQAEDVDKIATDATQIKIFSIEKGDYVMSERVLKSEDEWRQLLSSEQFKVLRQQGTEAAFSGKYWNNHDHGTYRCAACGLDLYRSEDKYESGTGWPSFTRSVAEENIATRADRSFFSVRTELLCSRCGGHLGHVFDDGPPPTGQRHCINSAALTFVKLDQ
jgi:peptide-methionine (R)-S-oxide reductase